MPYVNDIQRNYLKHGDSTTPGQLNYEITKLIVGYLYTKGKNYSTINDILGALEGAKMEFVRRVVNPYEAQKMVENGDVY